MDSSRSAMSLARYECDGVCPTPPTSSGNQEHSSQWTIAWSLWHDGPCQKLYATVYSPSPVLVIFLRYFYSRCDSLATLARSKHKISFALYLMTFDEDIRLVIMYPLWDQIGTVRWKNFGLCTLGCHALLDGYV